MATRSLFADATAGRTPAHYALAVPADERRALATGWLALALASLVGSGAFAILLVLARAPYAKDVLPAADFFRVALVVHVDLSVLVWFASFGGLLWSLNATRRWLGLGWAGLGIAAAATLLLCAAPFLRSAPAIMSNYVPVLDGPLFLGALLGFAAGCMLLVARSMYAVQRVGPSPDGAAALRFGLNAALVSAAVALLAFAWSYAKLPLSLDGKAYFEVLFWGGGHVLQFTWTLLMFVAWLALADASGARTLLSPRIAILLFSIGLVSVFVTPALYLAYDVLSVEHYRLQTWLMRIGGGLAIVPFALAMVHALVTAPPASAPARPLRTALACSVVLFTAGGLIGAAIHGSNVRIPAHYHGSIVGVTLAFMGLAYHLLPRLGFASVTPRWAERQIWLYAGGQLAHIAGLAWSGGYGVQRKVAGGDQVLRGIEQTLAMGLMGLGGLIAIAGGTLFLILALHAMLRARS
jgi:cytochrome c oxidase subunit I